MVQFYLDGTQLLAQDASAPYAATFDTTTVSSGTHNLAAVVTDSKGMKATSSSVSISIQNAPPSTPATSLPSGMSLWLDASSITPSNGKVPSWKDNSGNNLTASQPVAASQPTFDAGALSGNPVVRFDGRSTWMSVPLPINGLTAMTIFLVSSNAQNSFYGYGINAALVWNETAYWGTTFVGPFQTNVSYRFGTTQVSNSPTYNRPASIGANASLTEVQHNGSTDSLYVNGILVESQGGKQAAINGTVPVLNLAQTSGGSSYFAGDIAEVIIYPRVLSVSEQQEVQTYLMSKYSLY